MERKNTESNIIDQINAQYGKLPPQAIEIEEAVLGAMILEADAYVNNPVNPEWFYKSEHKIIISAIKSIIESGNKIDLIQVTKKLNDLGKLVEIGGPIYITQLTRNVASAGHIEQHIRIIQQEYARREIIRFSNEIQNQCYDNAIDLDDIFTKIQHDISSVMSFGDDKSVSYRQATENLINQLNTTVETGLKTGLYKYDKFTGGLHLSDLIIIAAETSQGKTSLALTIFKNCVINGCRAAIFSLEMTKEQLVARITAQQTGISAKNIMYNKLLGSEKHTVISELENLKDIPIYFDESTTNNIDKICTSIRKLKIKYDINLVLVDYIQDMKGANDESGIAEIGRKLKNIAKELNIAVVGISQLSRDKSNPEPNRARLRGSGQLEEKADIVILLYRPEEYNKSYSEPHEMTSTINTAQVKIAKGRNVGTGSFILGFNKETTNFYDYIENDIPEISGPF